MTRRVTSVIWRGWCSAAACVAGTLLGGGGAPPPAVAQIECAEIAGRTRCASRELLGDGDVQRLSCRALWELRNTFFKARGYCFRTPDAIKVFGNVGCEHHNEQEVPFNSYERDNVKLIRQVEAQKSC